MSVVALISLLTAIIAFNLLRTSNDKTSVPSAHQKAPVAQAIQQIVPTMQTTPITVDTPTVTSGTVAENLRLSCGPSCNDPIQVTINTVQVDDANGHMTWNTTLKDVTGNNYGYSFVEYDLQAQGLQDKIPATYSQSNGTLTSNNPYSMQATFAFVPVRRVAYTLTVIVGTYESTVGSGQITFNPVSVTF